MTDPREMKTAAKETQGFKQEIWNVPAQYVMFLANWEKVRAKGANSEVITSKHCSLQYKQNANLRKELLRTYGTTLVECNPSDERWGIAMPIDDPKRFDR